jgi:amyloid beta precursor protein binding protein 1
LIIGTDLDNATVKKVADRCAKDITEIQACIPFVLIRQYGLIGYMRIIVDEIAVSEQKPFQVAVRDLRVNEPFPELLEYVNSLDMEKMPIEEHGHTPWVVVLIKAANKWVAEKGKLPQNFNEKKDFKAFIKTLAMDASKELNFDEAIANSP